MSTPIGDYDDDRLFNPPPPTEPDRMIQRLMARYGAVEPDLLRRSVIRETQEAIRMANEP